MKTASSFLCLLGFLAVFSSAGRADERIVSLGGSVTETIFVLGGEALLVGRDASSLFPEEALKLPDVGYFRTIGAEGVLSRNPSLILAAQGTGPENQVDLLKKSGVRFVHLDAQPSAESTLAMIATVGREIGREAEAEVLASSLRAKFAEAKNLAAKSPRPPKAVMLLGTGAGLFQAAFDGTAGSAVIGLAGGMNPFSGHLGYKTASAEELIASDPDFIFIATRSGEVSGPALVQPKKAPEWLLATRAAREGRLLTLDMTYYLVFGPRSGDAVLSLAKVLHGGKQ